MRVIDVHHMGRDRVTCCWQVGDVLIDPGPEESHRTVLEALDGEVPKAILVTHIHLDHSGGVGAMLRHWDAEVPVYVHENGAPHLIDPSRLVKSAGQLWDDIDTRWGDTVPVPESAINLVGDGDEVLGFKVAYTPGHASHHVSYFHMDSGWAFVGDVAGVRVAPETHTLMPTPPPDIDVEAWHQSLDTVEAWEPEGIGVAHFGGHEDPKVVLADARRELDKWTELARTLDEDAYFERYEAESEEHVHDKEILASMRQANDPRLAYPGLERYWRKLGHERRG